METENISQVLYQYRFIAVIALLGVAAMLATVKGRLPLALRGLKKMLRKDLGKPAEDAGEAKPTVPGWRRFVAFVLVLIAFLLAVC